MTIEIGHHLLTGGIRIAAERTDWVTIRKLTDEVWRDGYQRAVDAMRVWAEAHASDATRAAVLSAADMIEAEKP